MTKTPTTPAASLVRSSTEIVSALTDSQRRHLLIEMAEATYEAKPLRKYVFDAADFLRAMRSDRSEDEAASMALNLPHTGTRVEIAVAIAERQGIALDPRSATLDDVIAMERKQIAARQ